MVWRSHTFSPDPTVRGRRGSADDATRVFRVLALWTFPFCHSRSDRFQCGGPVNTLDFHLRSICIQIPSARPVPTRDQSDPPMHPLVYSISIFSLLSAFDLYRSATPHQQRFTWLPHFGRKPKEKVDKLCERFKSTLTHDEVKVHFVGVW